MAPVIVFDDALLVATALLVDVLLDEFDPLLAEDALLLELPPVPTVIEKSFDEVLFQLSFAVSLTTSVSLIFGAVTVMLAPLVLDSIAVPLLSVTLDHV